jgi:autotransporter-associated beta strand protein
MKARSRNSFLLASVLTQVFGAAPLFSATPVFTGVSGELWSTAGNWTPSGVPVAADTATFTHAGTTSVRLDGATATSSSISFGNGAGFMIGNASGDTAKITHSSKTVTVTDAFNYAINLTNGGGTTTTSTGAYDITSATFNIAAGGRLTLDGRYYGASGGVRTLTKSTGTGILELTGDYTLTFLQGSLNAGTLLLNGTGSNPRLMGLGSIAAAGTLKIGSANPNLVTGTSGFHANTGIRLLSGTVDLNGFNTATTRIQGTATTGVITNNGGTDAVLALGDFGTTAGLVTTITNPVFGGTLRDGPTNTLGLTLTGGGGSLLTQTLTQAPTYTGATLIENGGSLITPGLAGASAITMNSSGTLRVDGPLANTAGIAVTNGTFDVRGAFSSGSLAVSGGALKFAPSQAAPLPIGSLNQSGGSIELDVFGDVADKLTTAGNMAFSGGTLTAMLRSAPTGSVVLAEYGSLTGTPTLAYSPDLSTTRLGTPTVDAVTGNKITLSFSGSVADLTWTAATDAIWDLSAVNWLSGASPSAFFNLDRVTFPDGASNLSIDLAATVTPGKMTFTSTGSNDYTITGAGGIAGLGGGLVKNGDAWLNLGGLNSFTGPVQINNGIVTLLTPQALGLTGGVTVASTESAAGQLNVNGMALATAGRSVSVTLSGDGPLGASSPGALVSTGSTSLLSAGSGNSGIRNVTLAADASVGGNGTGGSFDIGTSGTVNGGGFTLTKKGSNVVLINGPVANLKTVVEAGTLATSVSGGFGSSLLVNAGTTASCPNLTGTYIHTTDVTVESGGILQSGTSVTWNGPFLAKGNLTVTIDQTTAAVMTFPNDVTIPGNFLRNGGASGGSTSFLGNLNVTGTLTLSAGTLSLDGSGGSLSAASIGINSPTSAVTFNRSSNLSYDGVISGSGAVKQSGTGTTTLSGNNTYSGVTTISAGTLVINGTQTGTGNANLAAGSTLGGNGTFPGAATIPVNATLAPGVGIGTLTLGSTGKTTTINGTLRVQYDGSATPAIDMLKTGDALTLGAAAIIDFDPIGTPLTAPAYVIASYPGTLTGTFATATDLPTGYALVYNYNDGVTGNNIALVKTPYQLWIETIYPGETNQAIVGPNADPDGDGQSNLTEFALAGTPNNGAANARIYPLTLDSDDADTAKELLLTIAVRAGTPAFTGTPSPTAPKDGCTYTVQGSLDLAGFAAPVSVVAPVTTGLPAVPAGYEYRTFSLAGSNNLPGKGFLRVRVTP